MSAALPEFVINGLDGESIFEGDEIFVFRQEYKLTKIEEGIYEEHHDKPLPVHDVPLAKGIVYWSEDMLAWWVRLTWVYDGWEPKPCGISMGGGCYAYQKPLQELA